MLHHRTHHRTKSHKIFGRALELMPGGVNSPARAFGAVGGEPIVIERGSGPFLHDVDGNRYIDYIGSWGPMILGHAFPKVLAAIQDAVGRGTSFGAPTQAENDLAERIITCVPSIEKVRLVNSGTEATMSAIRLARGHTERDLIVKFAGNYHGHVDSLLVAAGSSAATLAVPNSPGVTKGTSQDTLVLQYNDTDALCDLFERRGAEIAAVILEPVVGNMGCVIPTRDFLNASREVTRQHGALLIFDEVMTGFRLALGGAQERFQVTPDITTLGKIVGGGLPLGAYGGSSEIMNQVLPAGKVFQAGTLSGNPLATAAGIAMLDALREHPPYEYLESISMRLAAGLEAAATRADIPFRLQRVGSMLTLFFQQPSHRGQPIMGWQDASTCDVTRFGNFFWGMMERGSYLPCSQFEAWFVSAAHTETEIDSTIAAAEACLAAGV